MRKDTIPSVFISYSHRDQSFARRLQVDLDANELNVWLDEKEIEPGDSIVAEIEQGLRSCNVFILLVSESSASSPWVSREYESALSIQLSSPDNRPKIIPILIDSSNPPPLLRSLKWISFRESYIEAVIELFSSLGFSKPYIRTDRLLQEFEQLKSDAEALASSDIYPSHDFFNKVELLEERFNELRRCIASIQPLRLDRRFWLILGQEHLPLRERVFDLELYPVESLKTNVRSLVDKVQKIAVHPDFSGILSYPARRYFGAGGGSKGKTWYMYCAGRGIFRNAPYDGAKPYVELGSRVNGDIIICRIESRTKSSEMLSCIGNGIVTEICVNDGDEIDDKTILFRGIHPR